MNGLDGELLVALSEIPLPERLGEVAAAHVAVVVAILARNPRFAAAWGQVLTEHTGPAEPPPARPMQLADHAFEGPGPACSHRPGRLGSCGRHRSEHAVETRECHRFVPARRNGDPSCDYCGQPAGSIVHRIDLPL